MLTLRLPSPRLQHHFLYNPPTSSRSFQSPLPLSLPFSLPPLLGLDNPRMWWRQQQLLRICWQAVLSTSYFFSVQTSSSSFAAAADHVPQLLDIATHLTLLHNHFSILVATIRYQTLTGPAAPCSSSSAAEADHLPHRRMAVRPSSSSAAPEHLPHQRQRRCAHREDSEASAAFSQTTAPPAAFILIYCPCTGARPPPPVDIPSAYSINCRLARRGARSCSFLTAHAR